MYENNVNPYLGDLYHENPLILYASNLLIRYASPIVPYLFVGCDLLCAFLLYRMAKDFIAQQVRFFFIQIIQSDDENKILKCTSN